MYACLCSKSLAWPLTEMVTARPAHCRALKLSSYTDMLYSALLEMVCSLKRRRFSHKNWKVWTCLCSLPISFLLLPPPPLRLSFFFFWSFPIRPADFLSTTLSTIYNNISILSIALILAISQNPSLYFIAPNSPIVSSKGVCTLCDIYTYSGNPTLAHC